MCSYLIGIIGLSIIFINTHEVPYTLVCIINHDSNQSYSCTYKLINGQKEMESYLNLLTVSEKCMYSNNLDLDFSKYTYVIVQGAKLKRMYWSFKRTLFDDPSPAYAKAYREGKKSLFVQYNTPDGGIYIYRINKNFSLSNLNGL